MTQNSNIESLLEYLFVEQDDSSTTDLEEMVQQILESILVEVNSISVGGAILQTPDSIQGFQGGGLGIGATGEGGEEGAEGLEGDISDENFDQVGQREKHRKQLFDFFWNGDKANNPPPKVKYVAV